jgi:hypothetical protein
MVRAKAGLPRFKTSDDLDRAGARHTGLQPGMTNAKGGHTKF